jgi:hypothetical protein
MSYRNRSRLNPAFVLFVFSAVAVADLAAAWLWR